MVAIIPANYMHVLIANIILPSTFSGYVQGILCLVVKNTLSYLDTLILHSFVLFPADNYLFSFQNTCLHPSERMPPQTTKEPTGPFDRDHLITHLKREAENSKVCIVHIQSTCIQYMYIICGTAMYAYIGV